MSGDTHSPEGHAVRWQKQGIIRWAFDNPVDVAHRLVATIKNPISRLKKNRRIFFVAMLVGRATFGVAYGWAVCCCWVVGFWLPATPFLMSIRRLETLLASDANAATPFVPVKLDEMEEAREAATVRLNREWTEEARASVRWGVKVGLLRYPMNQQPPK